MSANIQSINTMFEFRPISASAEFQPFEQSESEVPPIELVAELIKVELQEFRLYVMVCVENAPFGIADGDMHPRQYLAHFLLVLHDYSLVGGCHPILFKGCVCVGTIRGDVCLPVRRLSYSVNLGGSLQIINDFHLYVPHGFGRAPFLPGGDIRETAFGHDKDRGLALAATPAFERTVLLAFRRFGGEKAFVYLHVSMEVVACVTLAHHVTKLVHHLPYGLVTLAPQLALDFLGGYGTFGGRQEEHGGEPVTDGQVAPLHHRAGTQGHFMFAVHAGPRSMAGIPAQAQAAATAAEKAVAFTEMTKSFLTGTFVRILAIEIKQIHSGSFHWFNIKYPQIVFQ